MTSVTDLVGQINKDYGNIAMKAVAIPGIERLPTGWFPFDLAIGGGLPEGKVTTFFGPESSGKTNAALKAIGAYQQIHPKKTCVFVDVEHSFDSPWAQSLGVDLDKLLVIKPGYAEQTVDIIDKFLREADDLGLMVVDSIAAMITTNEAESSAEKAVVGGNALVIGKLGRKLILGMAKAFEQGRTPTIILINQIRYKIGVMFGDPETMPGGKIIPHISSLIVRFYGKNIVDPKINKELPCRKKTSFILKKWKCQIVQTHGEYEMVTIPHDDMEAGEVSDWNLVSSRLKAYGHLVKGNNKQPWILFGEVYKTLVEIREKLAKDGDFDFRVRKVIFDQAVAEANNLPVVFDGFDLKAGEKDITAALEKKLAG